MGIFSKIFHTDKLELHDEEEILNDVTQQDKIEDEDENETISTQNTESSPFLTDEQNADTK